MPKAFLGFSVEGILCIPYFVRKSAAPSKFLDEPSSRADPTKRGY